MLRVSVCDRKYKLPAGAGAPKQASTPHLFGKAAENKEMAALEAELASFKAEIKSLKANGASSGLPEAVSKPIDVDAEDGAAHTKVKELRERARALREMSKAKHYLL